MRDSILANKVGLSYPRQLEIVHGAIERILKAFVIKEYGIELLVHEVSAIYDAIKSDLNTELSRDDYQSLKMLDTSFILDRYPTENRFYNEEMIDNAFAVLININSLVQDVLNLSKRAKRVIQEVENEISITKNIIDK
ncbi:MAG: HEPN domain-containing protein [Sarcina sp.]